MDIRDYKDLKDDRGWQLQCHQIRQLLGINVGKLPNNDKILDFRIGNVNLMLLPKAEAKARAPKTRHPHRLIARCPRCSQEVGAGKLFQHQRSQACKDKASGVIK